MIKNKSVVVPEVEKIINYQCNNPELCWEALQGKQPGKYPEGNKRLAMIGDKSMAHAQLKEWYGTGTSTEAGTMIVCTLGANSHLIRRGKQLGLDKFINPSPSQKGVVNDSLVADTVEALIGAVEMDGATKEELEEVMRRLGVL
ncbi:Ribonuclease [Lachnellula hyalina]|uniref:Ribonuclease n=1 Tax=Lachnellula hyalina TaxID=1316788 RepID=A0A8H8QXM0_9HELO|nr:Ribonuclease [Lachnellula hyalina]TVY24020.1 Ribonuclease [Lachnellula hyalina]